LASRDTAAGKEDDSDMIYELFGLIGCIDDDPSDTEPGSPSLETCSEPSSTPPLASRELSHDIMSAQEKTKLTREHWRNFVFSRRSPMPLPARRMIPT
jgi:hypothetical protein